MAKKLFIITPYITLGQLLKETNIITTGGQAKWYLYENKVLVNQEIDRRRGRKLYIGDVVTIPDDDDYIINGVNVINEFK